jgi:UDP-glucose 4-epimerase
MQDKPMTVFGDGLQTRAFSYVSDVVSVMASSIERPQAYNKTFNVGADKSCSVLHLAQTVAKAMGRQPDIRHLEARKEVVHAFSSHDKVSVLFGDLIKNVSLEEGVARMVKWAQTTGSRPGKKFENIEVEKNMPSSWKQIVR